MTREIAHQQSFEKALYSIQPNFPPGKLAGMPQFANVYFNMSTGDGDARGPWNKEPTFEYREAQPAVDGGDGLAAVCLDAKDLELVNQAALRLQSDPKSDPVTGAMLGMDRGDGSQDVSGNRRAAAEMGPKPTKSGPQSQKGSPSRKPS